MTKVLVTGGTGLYGKAIEAVIKEDEAAKNEEWVFLSSKDGDLVDRKAVEAIFEKHKPTHVIHLAAKVGGLFHNMRKKVDFYRDNTLINDNVMECCRIYGVKKLVSCLSTCIFPDKTSYPIDETMLHNGPPHTSNLGYSCAKRMVDVLNHCYKDQYDLNYTSVIPTNIYGEFDNYSIRVLTEVLLPQRDPRQPEGVAAAPKWPKAGSSAGTLEALPPLSYTSSSSSSSPLSC
ncbi:unnamed protein product [Prorocentrum cordatum]|uniref:NAD-dependent epimerase/dehydratase domain-containing protein n=1 Tax=Prorocentrum cordatum TaxID=2364126 RepID=A0ABN9YK65_9DINO|nr:unnamed protein product [Polarella glacialis]